MSAIPDPGRFGSGQAVHRIEAGEQGPVLNAMHGLAAAEAGDIGHGAHRVILVIWKRCAGWLAIRRSRCTAK